MKGAHVKESKHQRIGDISYYERKVKMSIYKRWKRTQDQIEKVAEGKGKFGEKYAFPNNNEYLDVVMIGGKPYFPATDCARRLGYSDPSMAIKQHSRVDGRVKRPVIDKFGRSQDMNLIPEGDLYRLIVHSKLLSTERFESWVLDEVLPMIRKTGGYVQHNKEIEVIGHHYSYLDEATKLSIFEQIEKHRQEYDEGNSSKVVDTC